MVSPERTVRGLHPLTCSIRKISTSLRTCARRVEGALRPVCEGVGGWGGRQEGMRVAEAKPAHAVAGRMGGDVAARSAAVGEMHQEA